jgi:histone H3/H4
MSELVVIRSKLKDVAKGINISGDFADALDKKVRAVIAEAVERAKANNRKTVMGKDV